MLGNLVLSFFRFRQFSPYYQGPKCLNILNLRDQSETKKT